MFYPIPINKVCKAFLVQFPFKAAHRGETREKKYWIYYILFHSYQHDL